MLEKLASVARLAGAALAIIAGLVPLAGFDVTTALIILGLIGGITIGYDMFLQIAAMVIALPIVATVLAQLPVAGAPISAIVGNFAIAIAASFGMAWAIGSVQYWKNSELKTITGGNSAS